MFSTAFQKYKEKPIPPNIKLPKHKKTQARKPIFPYLCPLNPIIMENEIQTFPETQTEAIGCEATNTTKCLNCGTEFEGKYCPECGQKADTGRFTMRFVFQNLLTAILSNDGGVWFTLKNLFTRPSAMVVEILNGKRKRYFSPFPMLFFALTVYILLFSFTGSRREYYEMEKNFSKMEQKERDPVAMNPSQNDHREHFAYKIAKNVAGFYNNHYTAVYMLTLPIFAAGARISFGRSNRRRYYWAEYLVAITYAMVMVIFYRCLTSMAYLISESLSDRLGSFTSIAIIVAFTACFRKMMGFGIGKTLWRSVLTLTLYYVFLGLVFAFGITIFVVYISHRFG